MTARFWSLTLTPRRRQIRTNKRLDLEQLATTMFRFEVAEVNQRLTRVKAHLMTMIFANMLQKLQMQIKILLKPRIKVNLLRNSIKT